MKKDNQKTKKFSQLIAQILIIATLLGGWTVAHAEIFVYRDALGKLLFTDSKIEREGFKLVRTLGSLAYAPTQQNLPSSATANYQKQRAAKNSARYDNYIKRAARVHSVDPALIKAVIHAESSFNRKAISHAGAQGLMQLMPATASDYNVTDPFNPRQNINAGTQHLKFLMRLDKNDTDLVLAAYNAGQANVRKYNGIPPFRETQNYVVKVKRLHKKYQSGAY